MRNLFFIFTKKKGLLLIYPSMRNVMVAIDKIVCLLYCNYFIFYIMKNRFVKCIWKGRKGCRRINKKTKKLNNCVWVEGQSSRDIYKRRVDQSIYLKYFRCKIFPSKAICHRRTNNLLKVRIKNRKIMSLNFI